jgi:hypothetical protein
MDKLTWKRGAIAGVYFAYDEQRQYCATRVKPGTWELAVKKTIETAGVQHAMGQPIESISNYPAAYAECRELAEIYHQVAAEGHCNDHLIGEAVNRFHEQIKANIERSS